MFRYFVTLLSLLVCAVGYVSVPSTLLAQEAECPITVSAVSGSVTWKGSALSTGGSIAKGDTVNTGDGGSLELNLGGAILKLGPRSSLYVDVSFCPDASSRTVRLKLLSGSLWAQGNTSAPKFDIVTERFLATVGTSTISIKARYLDTTFTVAQQSQMIETRDWKDTVEVQHYTFPYKGHVATIFALTGNVTVVPWGGRGTILKQGNQAVYGYDESFISSKPSAINTAELVFDPAGTYSGR